MGTSYVERLKQRTGKKFRRAAGIRQRTFRQLCRQARGYLEQERRDHPLKRRGKKSKKMSIEDKLLLTLLYLRQYHTFDELGEAFGISESYAQKIFHHFLDILVKLLRLPGKKALLEKGIEAVVIDVTEQPMERPVWKQRQWFSGKKKRHTLKTQLIVCLNTLRILLTVCDKGRTHDFKILKKARLRILKEIKKYGDSGYQGIAKLYDNCTTPHKKPKGGELTPKQKKENRILARLRIPIEHVNRRCKIFRIVKETYRGKHKNFSKVWTVIAGLVNLRYA